MNMSRVALAAGVAFVVDQVYGFLVWGTLLMPEFERYPAVFRAQEGVMANMPLMMVGGLLGMFVLAYIYAKGYEGGNGLNEGLRFGSLIGLFMVGWVAIGNYCVLNIGRKLAVESAVAAFVEAVMVGVLLGVIYKSTAQPRVRPAATA